MGMIHSAKESIELVNGGRVNPDGVEVILPEYTNKIANGEEVTLKDATSIVSFLLSNIRNRKHGWEDPANLSNERIMWQAQGGCQAFKWSHDIVDNAIKSGELSQSDVANYVSPDEFLSNGGCY